jgi:predicted nucleic acid-binding protein
VTFDDIPDGSDVFVDANILIYHFGPDPNFGAASTRLIERIERSEIRGYVSTHVLSDVAHRMMSVEVTATLGRAAGMTRFLKRHPSEIQKLTRHRATVQEVLAGPFQVLPITPDLVADATLVSQQHGLLHNDALIVAVMQAHGLTNLASHDADFDRVPGLTRFAPA